MIGVIVTFQYTTGFDEAKLRAIAEEAQHMFIGMPGVRSKAFTIDATNRRALNFYLWESRQAAEGFFTPELSEFVSGLYGAPPEILFLEVAAVVDNANRSPALSAATV